jgi:hypothetical protein
MDWRTGMCNMTQEMCERLSRATLRISSSAGGQDKAAGDPVGNPLFLTLSIGLQAKTGIKYYTKQTYIV